MKSFKEYLFYNFVGSLQWVPTHVEVMLVSWKLLCAIDLDTDDYYEEVNVVKWTLSQHLITNLFHEPLCILESSVNNLLYSDRVTLVTVASIALSRFTVQIFIQTEMNEIQLVKVQTSRSKSWQLLTRTFLSQQPTKFESHRNETICALFFVNYSTRSCVEILKDIT